MYHMYDKWNSIEYEYYTYIYIMRLILFETCNNISLVFGLTQISCVNFAEGNLIVSEFIN